MRPRSNRHPPNRTRSIPSPTKSNLVRSCSVPIATAGEQAVALVHALVDAGFVGKSLNVDQLCGLHFKLCEETGSIPRGWLAISRELKRIGLPKAKLWTDEEMVTIYEIAAPPANVVQMARKA